MIKLKLSTYWRAFALGLAVCAGTSIAVAEETLEDCRAIATDAERLSCYDRVYSQPKPQPAPVPEAEPAPAAEPTVETAPEPAPQPDAPGGMEEPQPKVVPLDDEVGSEALSSRKDDGKDEPLILGHVRNCKKNNNGRFFFFFDNGQVWKQKDNTRIPWRNCDFDVTIEKDFFGYRMTPVGETRRVRIARVE